LVMGCSGVLEDEDVGLLGVDGDSSVLAMVDGEN
jgi:hypothetical protein